MNLREKFDPTRQWRGLPPEAIAKMQARGSQNVSQEVTEEPVRFWTPAEMREFLESCDYQSGCKVVASAVIELFRRQTSEEAADGATREQNGRGFNSRDAEFLTSLAKQAIKRRSERQRGTVPAGWQDLSEPQFVHAKTKLVKYAGQLSEIANEKLLAKQASESQED